MGRKFSSHDEANIILFPVNQNAGFGFFPMGPLWVCTLIPGNQQSSIWKVGKEGGKCKFLLFDDK